MHWMSKEGCRLFSWEGVHWIKTSSEFVFCVPRITPHSVSLPPGSLFPSQHLLSDLSLITSYKWPKSSKPQLFQGRFTLWSQRRTPFKLKLCISVGELHAQWPAGEYWESLECSYYPWSLLMQADVNQLIVPDMEVWVFLNSSGTRDNTSATLIDISI